MKLNLLLQGLMTFKEKTSCEEAENAIVTALQGGIGEQKHFVTTMLKHSEEAARMDHMTLLSCNNVVTSHILEFIALAILRLGEASLVQYEATTQEEEEEEAGDGDVNTNESSQA